MAEDQGGRRILVTGASRYLGLRLAKLLERDERVEQIVAVDLDDPPVPIDKLEFVRADIRSPLIARVLESARVDTMIHTNIQSRPGRLGGRSQLKENNVIGTLQLLAAAQRSSRLRKVVVKSSTAVYGSGPEDPSIIPEDHASRHTILSGYGKDCADAETYARDFGRRRPDVDLVILRTQNVIGPTVRTNLTDYFSLPVIPSALGFDPRLQLLHEEDAVEAFQQVIFADIRGIFNVAAPGVVFLSQAARLLGKLELPLLPPAIQMAADVLTRMRRVDFPTDQLRLLVHGRVVDIKRARDSFGFAPRYTTLGALLDFRDHRSPDFVVESSTRPTWERDLIEYLKRKSTSQTRTT